MLGKRRLDNKRDAGKLRGRRLTTLQAFQAGFRLFAKTHRGSICVRVTAYDNPMGVAVDGMQQDRHGLDSYCWLDIQDLPAVLATVLEVLGVAYSRSSLRGLRQEARDILSTVYIEKSSGQETVVKVYRTFRSGPRIIKM